MSSRILVLCVLVLTAGCCIQARPEPSGAFEPRRASAWVSGVSTDVAGSEVGTVVPWVSQMLVAAPRMSPSRGPAAKAVLRSPSQGRYYDTDSLEVQAYPQWNRQPDPEEEEERPVAVRAEEAWAPEPSERPVQSELYQQQPEEATLPLRAPAEEEETRPAQEYAYEAQHRPEAEAEQAEQPVQLMSVEPDSPPVITQQQAPLEREAAAPRTTSPRSSPEKQRAAVKQQGSTNAAPPKKQQATIFSKATRYAVNKVLQSYRRPAHTKLTKRQTAELVRHGATTKRAVSLQSRKTKLANKARMTAAPKTTKAGKVLRSTRAARKAAAAARHAARVN